MTLIQQLIRDKRFLTLGSGLFLLTAYFWLSSRYPALDAKAMMAGSIELEDGLSFNARFVNSEQYEWLRRALTTYLNWINTNKQGMVFGLSFAVLLMSLLSVVKPKLSGQNGPIRSTLFGFLLGTPLGVCVNCAAPVAFGLYQKGTRIEMALSAMISSPTLNVVVLSMAITLFSLHIVAIKIVLTLICIFLVIPLLARMFPGETFSSTVPTSPASCESDTANAVISSAEKSGSWVDSVVWSLKEILRNARYVVVQVVPVMLLAGLLGSIAISILPWNELVSYLPEGGGIYTILTMGFIALFGLFLPVPIAFDVVISAILLSAGVPIKYVAVFLFVLGSFSIYSYLVLVRAGAKKTAAGLALSLMILGVIAGVSSHYLDKLYQKHTVENYYSSLLSDTTVRDQTPPPKVDGDFKLVPGTPWKPLAGYSNIEFIELLGSEYEVASPWKMEQVEDSGLKEHRKSLIHQLILPYSHMNSITSGDLNRDNRIDLVVGTTQGVFIYLNDGARFHLIETPFAEAFDQPIGAVAMTDLNNDGWSDLVFNVYQRGEYVAYNRFGELGAPELIHPSDSFYAIAMAFGDTDNNGELDIVVGNNNGTGWSLTSPQISENKLLRQDKGAFSSAVLPGVVGETLSLLLSDLDNDSYLDLFVANDFDEPDDFFWGTREGNWRAWDKGSLSAMTRTTMSLDSADINNDLLLDTFHAQISQNPPSPPMVIGQKKLDEVIGEQCAAIALDDRCQDMMARDLCRPNVAMGDTDRLANHIQSDCIAAVIFKNGFRDVSEPKGHYLSEHYPDIQGVYQRVFRQPKTGSATKKKWREEYMKQIGKTNLLYIQSAEGDFDERAKEMGLNIGGWAWNSKFSDLDGDGFQDVLIVNGLSEQRFNTVNIWFKNSGGNRFMNQSSDIGLDSYEPTLSYTYIDYDNDGDLDIVTFSMAGELVLYKNTNNPNNHLQIELSDTQGNRSGIGSRVVVHYGNNGELHQLREIKASGGYLSIDAPIAHFGLGKHEQVDKLEVRWSTGETEYYTGPFDAGSRYKFIR